VGVFVVLMAAFASVPSVAGAVTLDAARAKALTATQAERGRPGMILFGLRSSIRGRSSIRESGRRPPPTGLSTRAMRSVLTVGREPAYFFYLDRGAYQDYEHPGRVILVGRISGKVTRSRTLRFAPVINGRLPVFLRSREGYELPAYRVAVNDYSVSGAVRAASAGPGPFGARAAATAAATPRSAASESLVVARLAAEKSCMVVIGGPRSFPIGSLGAQGPTPIMPLLTYNPSGGRSLSSFVATEAIGRRGCRDILIGMSGDGYRSLSPPSLRTSLTTTGSRMREYHVNSSVLRSMIAASPSVTFKLMIDGPGSGAYIEALKSLTNVVAIATSSTASQTAYRYLPSKSIGGNLTRNPLRMRMDSSFFTTLLFGGAAFAASDAEVVHAANEVAAGRAPSFLAYMVARAFELSRPFDFTADLGATQRLYTTFPVTPPGPINRAPVATASSVTTAEDTAVPITLNASDPDGNPLTFTLGAPAHGTLTGTAPNLTYTPAADYNGPDSFTFSVSDGSLTSATATVSITVTAVDDPPVTTASGTLAYTENDPPTPIAPALTVTDIDSANLTGASVQITGNHVASDDLLALPAQPGITAVFDAPTGTLTLSGTATVAAYQAALRAVTYANTSDDPGSAPRTVTFRSRDAGGFGPSATRSITITPVNDPPAITTSAGPMSYAEGAPAAPVDAGLVLTDPDSQITGATVQITGNLASGQDVLALAAPPAGITAAYNSGTGTLTLSGTASAAAYQAALQAVTYRNTSNNPSTATRTVTFLASDASSTSAPATRNVDITASDNPPDVDNSPGALAYTENDPPTAIDSTIAIIDVDSANLTGALVTITGNYAGAEDVLALPAQPNITAVYAAGTLTLSGTATIAEYVTALEAVTYANTSDNPSTLTRTVTYQARDAGGYGAADTHGVTVAAVDDSPVAMADATTVAEDSGATAVPVLPNDTDVDGGPKSIASVTQPANGTVVITGGGTGLTYAPNANYCNSPPATTLDTFTYTLTPGGSSATVSMTVTCVDDPPVAVNDSATVAEDSGPNAVDVLANDTDIDGGPKSVAAVTQPANGAVAITGGGTGVSYTPNANYCNSPPGTTPDTFTYTLNGGSSATVSMTVTCVDDPPVAVNDSATVAEDSGPNAVDVLANDTDIDGGPKSVASVTQPANGAVVITGGGTAVSYAPNANYCNSPPGTTPDTFTYTLNGGSIATVSGTVTCAADPPDVTTSAGPLAYTENDPATPIDPGVTVTDPDAGAMITGATVAITANFAAGQDVLALTGLHAPITAGPQIGNTLTLTGTATPAAYQAALRDVTYVNTSEGPSTSPRTVTFTVTDDTALSDSATRGITVAAVNDPPNAVDDAGTTDEDTPLNVSAPGVLANDTDVDPGDTKTVVKLNGTATLTQTLPSGASVTINANGSYAYNPLNAFQGLSTGQTASDTFTYTMQDGAGAQSTATVTITINGVSDAPTAVADSFDAIGNTGLFVGTTRPATQAGREISGSLLDNDTDPDTPHANLVVEPVTDAPTTLGGTITIESDGNFTYQPDDVDTGVTDTFTYRVCDASPCNSGTVANSTGTLSLPIAGQVWYVRNNEPAGGDGTSDTPFDTLAEAEAASGTGDTVFVFDGTNTTTNLDTGYAMNSGERLIGESRPLSLDPDGGGPLPTSSLFPGTSGAQPTLTASNEDVIVLASNVLVDGVDVDPSGTGGGISGGAGVDSVTVRNVNVTDTGTLGTQPGIELDGTTGVNLFTGVTVTNGGSATAIGVRINNADRVLFSNTATNTISTTGAKALDVASTSLLTSRWNDITVTGSGTGAIRLNATTGQPVLGDGGGTDLSLQTTSGATAALDIASSNTVTVDSAGTDTISAIGGPAMDIRNSNGSQFFFDSASSTNSAGDGINLDTNLTAPVVINGGAIAGAAGIAFDVNGGGVGGGGVVYDGAINDGPGQSVEVTGRDGGGVTLSGNIADGADVGGGIVVSGNSAGSTTFSGASKVLNTGSGNAVALSSNGNPTGGHLVSFTGGGLDIDTTSGTGLSASNGTLTVGGTGNSITTGTGTGLNVDTAGITAGNLNFDSISSNGATNGIRLNSTGTTGGLNVTGAGGACATTADACTGGTIQSTSQDGVSLSSAQAITLNRMKIRNNLGNGVRGNNVTNVALRDSVVDNNGDDPATDEAGLHFTNLLGTSDITRTLVANSPEDNARIVNSSGTLSQLNVTDSTFRDTDTVSPGNDGLLLQADGGSITADVLGSDFLRNRANGLQVITNGTGSMNVEVDDSGTQQSDFDDNNIGVSIAHNSSGTFSYAVRDLTIDGLNVAPGTGGSASPININLASAATTPMVGTVSGNTITNSNSSTGPGIRMTGNGSATLTSLVDANTISQVANRGIEVIARDGSNRINATISNNSVTLNNALSADAIRVDAGAVSTDTTTICADIRGNTATTTAVGLFGIRVRQRFAGTTFILEDYAGAPTDDAAVQTFLSTTNNGATTSADHAGAGFTSIADCPMPP
jgi:VCBS repeat-containing protein